MMGVTSERTTTAFSILIGAAGTVLGHPGPWGQIPVLVLLTPLCLFLLAGGAENARQAFMRGWLCGIVGKSAALYWIAVPVTDVGGLPLLAAVPLVILLGAYIGLYSGLSCLAAYSLMRLLGTGATRLCLAAICSGLAFAGMEVLCGFLFTGFPWLVPAAALVALPAWIQATSLIGAYGLGGIYCAGACLCAAGVFAEGRGRLAPLAAGLVLIVLPPVYGYQRLASLEKNDGPPVFVGMIQGNIDQNQKWEPIYQSTSIARYLDLSAQLIEEGKTNGRPLLAVFWPETSMPFYFGREPDKAGILRGFAAGHGVYLGFGTVGLDRADTGEPLLYNRFQVVGPDGMDMGHYDKQHLVPFGEYVPLNLDLAFITAMLQGVPFAPGRVSGPLLLPPRDLLQDAPMPENPSGEPPVVLPPKKPASGGLALGALICYEAIFPAYAQERVALGADTLLNISNDAWFGRTSSPLQHLHLAALRAVEQNRPMLRVTNTGYTALIDRAGRIDGPVTDLFTDDAVSVRVHPETELTVYHHLYGYVEGVLLFAAAFALFAHPATRRLRRT